MTLEELLESARLDYDLRRKYIKQYEQIKQKEIDRLMNYQWHDLCTNEEINTVCAPRTKGVVLGLVRQSMISNSEKLKKIDEIIKQLKEM